MGRRASSGFFAARMSAELKKWVRLMPVSLCLQPQTRMSSWCEFDMLRPVAREASSRAILAFRKQFDRLYKIEDLLWRRWKSMNFAVPLGRLQELSHALPAPARICSLVAVESTRCCTYPIRDYSVLSSLFRAPISVPQAENATLRSVSAGSTGHARSSVRIPHVPYID